MRQNQDIAIVFSQAFKIGLLSKYRKIPSCGYIAKEFNLRAKDTATITSETARRWLKGIALPEISKLIAISNWLQIDLNILLSLNKVHELHEQSLSESDLSEIADGSEHIIRSLREISFELESLVNKIKLKVTT